MAIDTPYFVEDLDCMHNYTMLLDRFGHIYKDQLTVAMIARGPNSRFLDRDRTTILSLRENLLPSFFIVSTFETVCHVMY